MNKSDLLDELRLEIGMMADKVDKISDFYRGLIQTFVKRLPPNFGVSIYQCSNRYFSRMISFGEITEKEFIKFGESMFSICSIRGKVTLALENNRLKAYAPFYEGHHLIGILFFEGPKSAYEICEDDYVFLQEISRFIEAKRLYYKKTTIDNLDL